jgi:NAD(P)-dependent dehydrogenase (short-subunit alcohol dehydrogenase family)
MGAGAGRLEGKTAVVTGASGGIGAVACRRFCEEGASVLGVDLAEEAGERLEAELRERGLDFGFAGCDVTSSLQVAALAATVGERFGGLDVLVNNAGAILGKPLRETTDEEWEHVLAVNLRGAFLTMRELVPLMEERSASIVNVASGLGLVGAANMSAYCAAKGGLVLLTKAAALELGPGIRVNVLCPGIIDTEMPRRLAGSLPGDAGPALLRGFEESHVVKRLGTPEEVVAVAVFLASDEASFVTGAAIPVDSGITAG